MIFYINDDKKIIPLKQILKRYFMWLRGPDLNQRPSGYEPDELPNCSTPRYKTTGIPVVGMERKTRFELATFTLAR